MDLPKLSIVTPSYNQGQFLEETILSVLNQNYPNLEYLVIDGGSRDNSVAIIKRYEGRLAYWVSEPDRGQIHALNKGLARATGAIFAFINSDDLYLPGAFSELIRFLRENPDCRWLCGDTIFFGEGHQTSLFRATVPRSVAQALSWSAHCPQPGMFWKRDLVASGFSEDWPYDFDHEMYVRLLLAGHKCWHIPLPVAAYRLHASSKTVAEGDRQDSEFDLLAKHYEERLQGADKRWCQATRHLRRAYKLGAEGRSAEGAKWLFRALIAHPEGLVQRPFWGTLLALLKSLW